MTTVLQNIPGQLPLSVIQQSHRAQGEMEQCWILEQGLVHPPTVWDVTQHLLLELEESFLQGGGVEGDGEEMGERLASTSRGNNHIQPDQKLNIPKY